MLYQPDEVLRERGPDADADALGRFVTGLTAAADGFRAGRPSPGRHVPGGWETGRSSPQEWQAASAAAGRSLVVPDGVPERVWPD